MKTRPSLTTTILSSSKYTQAASGGVALSVFSNLEMQFYIPTLQIPFALPFIPLALQHLSLESIRMLV